MLNTSTESYSLSTKSVNLRYYTSTLSTQSTNSSFLTSGPLFGDSELHSANSGSSNLLIAPIDYYFASHLIHLAKPDPKAFTFVANTMRLEPNTILFLDDNPYNIDSARQVGFIAHQVIGFDSTLRCLHRLGAL